MMVVVVAVVVTVENRRTKRQKQERSFNFIVYYTFLGYGLHFLRDRKFFHENADLQSRDYLALNQIRYKNNNAISYFLCFSISSRPALRSTQPPIKWAPEALSRG
jgi:hypothetical protein